MFCNNCGKELNDNAVVCPFCGAATGNYSAMQPQRQSATNGMAIAGFVLSFFFSLLGLIFSIIGLKKAPECNSGKGLAIAGIVISILGFILYIILIAELIAVLL